MIGVALALVVIGVLLLFLVPWVGMAAGIVGLILGLPFRNFKVATPYPGRAHGAIL